MTDDPIEFLPLPQTPPCREYVEYLAWLREEIERTTGARDLFRELYEQKWPVASDARTLAITPTEAPASE